jgi:hypothetical protein
MICIHLAVLNNMTTDCWSLLRASVTTFVIMWLRVTRHEPVLNPCKYSGNCVPPASAISISSFCTYGFHIILTVNRCYFLKQH